MLRTGIAGALAAVADVGVLVGLIEAGGLPPGLAAFFAAGVGAVVGFSISKYWAFRDSSAIDPRQLMVYGAVALANAVFVALSVHFLAGVEGVPYLYAKAASAVVVFVLWSYPAQALFVFRGASARA